MIDFQLIELKPTGWPSSDHPKSLSICFPDFPHRGKLQTRLRELLSLHKIENGVYF